MVSEIHYDVVVIGAGPVGCVTALAMNKLGLSVAVLELQPQKSEMSDGRTLALSWNSYLILNRLKVWSSDEEQFPIRRIQISDRGHFGKSVVSASDVQLPKLGFVVRYRDLLPRLRKQLNQQKVKTLFQASANSIEKYKDHSKITLENNGISSEITTRLVVMADGGQSLNIAGLKFKKTVNHGHDAIVGIITGESNPSDMAYERFTQTGPIALLPRGGEYAFVWSVPSSESGDLLNQPEEQFLEAFQNAFGDRCGRFTSIREKRAYSLTTRIAEQPSGGGIVVIGNASQALHPIAAQGLNLGLRDAWDLAELCGGIETEDLVSGNTVSRFRKKRRWDRLQTALFSAGLNRFFSAKIPGISSVRGLGLLGLDLAPLAKKIIMRQLIFGPKL